jgi:hypothetical protein
MRYEEWQEAVPEAIHADSLRKMFAYRLALFQGGFGWRDVPKLERDRGTVSLSDGVYRLEGCISSNSAEGYSRGLGKDGACFCCIWETKRAGRFAYHKMGFLALDRAHPLWYTQG